MKNTITLKGGILKGWYFEDDFNNANREKVEELNAIFEELYSDVCSVYAAKEKNAENQDIKIRLCNMLDWFFDKKVSIRNGFDNTTYKSKKAYRDYILCYGK